jgi:uncharacterized membrane protein
MIYKFDKHNLTYKRVTGKAILLIVLAAILISSISTLVMINTLKEIKYTSTETKAIILKEQTEFTPEKLKEYILELSIHYPHIVLAQAQLETGNFTSTIFKANNNLFGMKRADKRPNTAHGVQYDHAYYNTWRESVQDYAIFAAAYLKNIHTEEEYFEYLGQNYAEDPNYVSKLKQTIIKNDLVMSNK